MNREVQKTAETYKAGRRMTIADKRLIARSGKQIWKWLKFLVNKFNGLLKHLECDHTMIATHDWRPFPTLAKIIQLDLRKGKTKAVEIDGNLSARPNEATAASGPGGKEPQIGTRAVGIAGLRERESIAITSPSRARRRWIRRITIRVNRKTSHKRGVMDIENEGRRMRMTRKRRRIARGWVKQQYEFSETRGGAPGGCCGRRSSVGYERHYMNVISSPEIRTPDQISSARGRRDDLSSHSTTLVKYCARSRGRQKSTPFEDEETVDRLLPDELLEKVLAWLPITSVFRFRAVCKRWQYMLSGEGEKNIFFDKPTAWNACASFFSSGKGRREFAFFDDSARRWSIIDLDFLPRPACRLLAASGGLLCLSFAGLCSCVFICNPVTKSWRELPEFHHKRRRSGNMLVHLLVDKVTLSYKVIVIGHPSCLSSQSTATSTLTEVYDSQTDKWTALSNIPSSGCLLAPSMAFRNGILYCLTENPTGLLAFNIARKVWRRLEIKSHSRVLCILEHNGHILIVARLTARVTRLGIWRLRETFPRVWMKVALMPIEHALYFFLSGQFQCFAHGNFICFASPRRPRWLLFDISKRLWKWGSPARVLDPDNYNKWCFYEPRLDISP